ncbi:hypothetical protein ETB97_005400 [Aspergillus alliaceus]|uniref:Carboxymuconolactone decarboxylase-like domain-containing protein n=1 Tax=Petromyces alliaceus TaxID=209559 RepID=A0A8H6A1N1_PETAA|nr:hypothetical protein ETB97_005400 [Aspergillus burnettii]
MGKIGGQLQDSAKYIIHFNIPVYFTGPFVGKGNDRDYLITERIMLIALKPWPELAVHMRGAIHSGLTDKEISEVVLRAEICCGVPAGLEAVRVPENAIKDMEENEEFKRA